VHVDPLAQKLLIDYGYFCERFGHLPFGDFVFLWHAADALMQSAIEMEYEPYEVPELLITADKPRMAFIRSMVACFRPNVSHLRSPRDRIRRCRNFKPARRG
jgi:hypothetical protein